MATTNLTTTNGLRVKTRSNDRIPTTFILCPDLRDTTITLIRMDLPEGTYPPEQVRDDIKAEANDGGKTGRSCSFRGTAWAASTPEALANVERIAVKYGVRITRMADAAEGLLAWAALVADATVLDARASSGSKTDDARWAAERKRADDLEAQVALQAQDRKTDDARLAAERTRADGLDAQVAQQARDLADLKAMLARFAPK